MDDQIKPVAYRQYYERDYERDGCDGEFKLWELGPQMSPPDGTEPLYPQQSIDALRAEVERWKATAVFGSCGLSDHLTEMEARAERAEAEAEALRALLSPGLRVYKGAHVVQIDAGKLGLFTERYEGDSDLGRALRVVQDAAIDAARKGAE